MTNTREAIRPGELLLLSDFMERAAVGKAAWRAARRNAGQLGIRLDLRSGRQCYVDTSAWCELLRRRSELRRAAR